MSGGQRQHGRSWARPLSWRNLCLPGAHLLRKALLPAQVIDPHGQKMLLIGDGVSKGLEVEFTEKWNLLYPSMFVFWAHTSGADGSLCTHGV